MIGHVAGAGSSSSGRADRSFACLLAVYALHAAIFHVLCLDRPAADVIRNNTDVPRLDAVVVVVVPPKSRPENVTIFPRQRQQTLRPSELLPSRKNSTADRRHVTLKCGPQDSWFNWISNYSFIGGITSSTWAVISGCTIFLLTNCDRDELHDRRVNDKVDSTLNGMNK